MPLCPNDSSRHRVGPQRELVFPRGSRFQVRPQNPLSFCVLEEERRMAVREVLLRGMVVWPVEELEPGSIQTLCNSVEALLEQQLAIRRRYSHLGTASAEVSSSALSPRTPGILSKTLSVYAAMSAAFHPSGKLRSQSPGCGFHQSALLTACPPPSTLSSPSATIPRREDRSSLARFHTYHPAMTPVSSHATPFPSAQI